MNKTPRLSKSGIEYLDYMWGIWSGCYNWANGICPVKNCWAKGIATRFHSLYPNGFEPTFYPETIDSPKYLKKPSIIGVGWVGDVIGYCNRVSERSLIMQTILQCPQHTFLFLTKNPDRLLAWGQFPNNCWVGVTATNPEMLGKATYYLKDVKAQVKYLSFEPLLQGLRTDLQWEERLLHWLKTAGISGVILGSQTKPYKPPKLAWVEEIIEACRKADIPYFLKDNLGDIIPGHMKGDKLRQEMPKNLNPAIDK